MKRGQYQKKPGAETYAKPGPFYLGKQTSHSQVTQKIQSMTVLLLSISFNN